MRFLRAVGVGLITAIVGTVLVVFSSDYLTKLYHVSDMEGGRGMVVIFLFAPLGFIVGFIIGFVVSLLNRSPGFTGFVKTQGLAILITTALAGLVSGGLYLAADKPPTIGGKELTLDFELRLPPTIQLPAELTDFSVRVLLYGYGRSERYAEIDMKSIAQQDGLTAIPGTVALTSHRPERELLASIGNEVKGTQFIKVNLPGTPRKEHEAWSDWVFANQYNDLSPVLESERIAARYRVRPVD